MFLDKKHNNTSDEAINLLFTYYQFLMQKIAVFWILTTFFQLFINYIQTDDIPAHISNVSP